MSSEPDPARQRYFIIVAVNMVATAGAVFGLVIAGKTEIWEYRILGGALLLSSLYLMATLPRSLARRWRTPTGE